MIEDWQHCINVKTDSSTDCEERGCSSDDYCRCSIIEGIEVEDSASNVKSFLNCAYVGAKSELDNVLDFWFARKNFHRIEWGFAASGGYYGEELDRVFVENDGDFFKRAEIFYNLTPKEKIDYLLMDEYGKVLKEISMIEEWELKKVPVANIHKPSNNALNEKVKKNYEFFCYSESYSLRGKGTLTEAKFANGLKLLAPLCITNDNKNYRLIDGRHRLEAMTSKTYKLNSFSRKGKLTINEVSLSEIWIICPKE